MFMVLASVLIPLSILLYTKCTKAEQEENDKVCAARTLNATGQSRVTLSPR